MQRCGHYTFWLQLTLSIIHNSQGYAGPDYGEELLSGHLPVQVDVGGGRGGCGRGGGAGPAAAVAAAAAAAAAIVVAQWGRARVARIATQRRRTRAGPLVGRPAGKEISAATGCVMYDRDYNEVRFMILRCKEIISRKSTDSKAPTWRIVLSGEIKYNYPSTRGEQLPRLQA